MCFDVQNYCFEFSKVVRKVLSSLQQHRNVKFAEKEEQGQTAGLAAANHRHRKQSRAREFSKDENKLRQLVGRTERNQRENTTIIKAVIEVRIPETGKLGTV